MSKRTQGIDGKSPSRWSARSAKPDQYHGEGGRQQNQRIARRCLVNDAREQLTGSQAQRESDAQTDGQQQTRTTKNELQYVPGLCAHCNSNPNLADTPAN